MTSGNITPVTQAVFDLFKMRTESIGSMQCICSAVCRFFLHSLTSSSPVVDIILIQSIPYPKCFRRMTRVCQTDYKP